MFKFNFDEKLNEFLSIIVGCAEKFNLNIYIVGGAVRDYFLKVPIKDIDLILEGDAVSFSKNLPECVKIKSIHSDFSTVKVEYDGRIFDIASTRTERYPYSGCLPQVIKTGVLIEEDVARRDFTVNSLYCKLSLTDNVLNYELIDFYSGVDDIAKKELKVLHNKSYIDDPTRILRGLSYKFRFGFNFSSCDIDLIAEYLKNINRENISVDRCMMVFSDVLSVSPYEVFCEAVLKGYYHIIQPLELNIDFDDVKKCIDLFKPDKAETVDFLMKVILNRDVITENFCTDLDIFYGFKKYKSNAGLAYYYYKTSDYNVIKYLSFKDTEILLNGNDLIKLGYPKGRLFSDIFDELYKYKLANTNKILNKNDEINLVKTLFPIK